MLSGAKHLQYPLRNKQMQILRCAQDDNPGDSFRSLLGPGVISEAGGAERRDCGLRLFPSPRCSLAVFYVSLPCPSADGHSETMRMGSLRTEVVRASRPLSRGRLAPASPGAGRMPARQRARRPHHIFREKTRTTKAVVRATWFTSPWRIASGRTATWRRASQRRPSTPTCRWYLSHPGCSFRCRCPGPPPHFRAP